MKSREKKILKLLVAIFLIIIGISIAESGGALLLYWIVVICMIIGGIYGFLRFIGIIGREIIHPRPKERIWTRGVYTKGMRDTSAPSDSRPALKSPKEKQSETYAIMGMIVGVIFGIIIGCIAGSVIGYNVGKKMFPPEPVDPEELGPGEIGPLTRITNEPGVETEAERVPTGKWFAMGLVGFFAGIYGGLYGGLKIGEKVGTLIDDKLMKKYKNEKHPKRLDSLSKTCVCCPHCLRPAIPYKLYDGRNMYCPSCNYYFKNTSIERGI